MWDDLSEESRQHFLKDLKCFKCSSSDTEFIKILDDKVSYKVKGNCNQCGNSVRTSIFKGRIERYKKSALDKWNAIPNRVQKLLIDNVFCGSCGVTSIVDFDIKNDVLGIIIEGKCKKCGKKVARFIENE